MAYRGALRAHAAARWKFRLGQWRAQDHFDGQALRFGDTLDQKDQAVQTRCQCPDAIDKLVGAIFKPSHPGFKRSHSVDQIAFERDHPAIQAGNVVPQAVQSPPNGL
jgi:hypothetical protein